MSKVFNIKKNLDIRRKLRKNMTETELILWSCLKDKKLGVKFRRQHGVGYFVLDFYCPKYKLAIEVDGGIHQQFKQAAIDAERQKIIEGRKIKFLRFTNEQVKSELSAVLKIIKNNLY